MMKESLRILRKAPKSKLLKKNAGDASEIQNTQKSSRNTISCWCKCGHCPVPCAVTQRCPLRLTTCCRTDSAASRLTLSDSTNVNNPPIEWCQNCLVYFTIRTCCFCKSLRGAFMTTFPAFTPGTFNWSALRSFRCIWSNRHVTYILACNIFFQAFAKLS